MIGKHKWMAIMVMLCLAISLSTINHASAASEEQIEQSVSSGLAWLAGEQNSDGSWGSSDYEKVAATAFAVWKMEDRAYELNYSSPFDTKYEYSGNVEKGLDFLFRSASFEGDNSLYFGDSYHVYTTSIVMAAIAESDAPDRTVGTIGSHVDGLKYRTIEQYAQNYLIKAQRPSGGWYYEMVSDPNSEETGDNSNSGYAVVGLAYGQKFGIAIPQSVVDGINRWIGYIQCPTDGGSGYNAPCDPNAGKGGENILKTGNLLYEMRLVGDISATSRAQSAIQFIENHWNDPTGEILPGWISDGVPHYQAAFCMMKGFEAMGVNTIKVSGNDVDWFDEVSTAIINNQADGHWPADYWGDSEILSTEWALLTLERTIAQPSPTQDPKYETMKSFEQLLRDQHNLMVSFDNLMAQTPATKEQKIEFLYSIEDLYRRQAMGMDKFSIWIDKNWANLTSDEKTQITASLEDLLRRQAKNLETYNGNLLAWVRTFDPAYRQKFSDSIEDLLHRQVALLNKFDAVLNHDGMQTPVFLSSFEDLIRRQAQSLVGFGDLGEFTFNDTPPQEGAGIAIYETANNTSVACDGNVTYRYTVYNDGDEEVTDINVTDFRYGSVGEITSLPIYESRSIEKTVAFDCSAGENYPIEVCTNATAIGDDSSGGKVNATSNDVCIILNGPNSVTLQGQITHGAEGGCIILTTDDKSVYLLEESDANAWTEVNSILATEGCAEITGYACPGLPTTCIQGMPFYVSSCKRIDCPAGSSCPNRSNIKGVDVVLTGPITLPSDAGCYLINDAINGTYVLEMDENYPDAWSSVVRIEQEGECAKIEGCKYSNLGADCQGESFKVITPVFVKSCEEADCADLCASKKCPACQICNPADGSCIADSSQNGKACDDGGRCLNGGCLVPVNPCDGVTCPICQICASGSCVADQNQDGANCDKNNLAAVCDGGACVAPV